MRFIAVALQNYLRRDLAAFVADVNQRFGLADPGARDNAGEGAQSAGENPGSPRAEPAQAEPFITFAPDSSWPDVEELLSDNDITILFFYAACRDHASSRMSSGEALQTALREWRDQTEKLLAFLRDHDNRSIAAEALAVFEAPQAFYSLLSEACRLDSPPAPEHFAVKEFKPSEILLYMAQHAMERDEDLATLQNDLDRSSDLSRNGRPAILSDLAPAVLEERALLVKNGQKSSALEAALAAAEERNRKLVSQVENVLDATEGYCIKAMKLDVKLAKLETSLASARSENTHLKSQIKKTDARAKAAAGQLSAVHRSLSWRITKPIRGLKKAARLIKKDNMREQIELVRASSLFNSEWYLEQNPDIRSSNLDPVEHFVRYGGREGRSPGPEFSTTVYFQTYPDVQEAGMNPLVHYLRFGTEEGLPTPQSQGAG